MPPKNLLRQSQRRVPTTNLGHYPNSDPPPAPSRKREGKRFFGSVSQGSTHFARSPWAIIGRPDGAFNMPRSARKVELGNTGMRAPQTIH